MTLVRLDVRFDAIDALVEAANTRPVVAAITDADTIVTVGSLHDRLTSPVGVWLQLSDEYSAQMAGRDVATLSWLVTLDTVVISAANAEGSAQVVAALLTNDEVNFTNDVATLVGAYNRPAPPAPIAVWSWDGALLRHGDEALREASSTTGRDFDETTFR
jgi:hypothetical protein